MTKDNNSPNNQNQEDNNFAAKESKPEAGVNSSISSQDSSTPGYYQSQEDKDQNSKATDSREENSASFSENSKPKEYGGVKWGEPTKYGDWQHKGRASDF
jgi:hypothetical protein